MPSALNLPEAGDVGGEEVGFAPVEVAAGTVVVLGGARFCVAGQDLGVAERNAASRASMIAACRSECGLMCRAIFAVVAIRRTIR
jgi:hypothetical protein